MKTIIAPTDFSTASLNAVNYAADFAMSINAKLVLLNVVKIPIAVSEIPVPEPIFGDILRDSNQDLEALAEKCRIRTKGKIDISAEVMIGTIEYQIGEIVKEKKPLALVMGLTQTKSNQRFFFGSKTLSMIKHLDIPVLIIPEHVSFAGIKKIGLACDFENVNDTIPFDSLDKFLSDFNATLDIVHVNKEEEFVEAADVIGSGPIQKNLRKFHPEFHFLKSKNMTKELKEFVKLRGIDLLIVIPKKHSYLELFGERHSKEIALNMDIPILSLHARSK
jgi:nucleotide-binding universal stress UspA family protein